MAKAELEKMIINNAIYTDDPEISELFEIKNLSGRALLKLNSDSMYIINDDDLDTADIILLFYDADEC